MAADYDDNNFEALFDKYDENQNGYLEINEMADLIKECFCSLKQ